MPLLSESVDKISTLVSTISSEQYPQKLIGVLALIQLEHDVCSVRRPPFFTTLHPNSPFFSLVQVCFTLFTFDSLFFQILVRILGSPDHSHTFVQSVIFLLFFSGKYLLDPSLLALLTSTNTISFPHRVLLQARVNKRQSIGIDFLFSPIPLLYS